MRSRITKISVLVVLAIAVFGAQNAYASYLGVTVTPTAYVVCQPTTDTVGMYLGFSATVTAIGTSKPSKIRIGYQVVDRDSKRVIRSGVTNLKRSKSYKATSDGFVVTLSEKLAYHLNMSYKSGGKTHKLKKTFNANAPDQAALDSLGITACS